MAKIKDYISGLEVNDTDEELVTQFVSKMLVEDYEYDITKIQTRPQRFIGKSPSDKTGKGYPLDITVYNPKSNTKNNEDIWLICELKQKDVKDGENQLKKYLNLTDATYGIWSNGEDMKIFKKIVENGKLAYQEIQGIPNWNGVQIRTKNWLKKPSNLKNTFKILRNHLAGNFKGATRDEELARQLINVIFCKLYDEKYNQHLKFYYDENETLSTLEKRVVEIFKDVKKKFSDVFAGTETITLKDEALAFVVGQLQKYSLLECERDVVGDAFETFIGYSLKGSQGQFFTPRNVVKMMVELTNPNVDTRLIDPSCGSGGFCVEALRHIWTGIDNDQNILPENKEEEKARAASACIHGIDKDEFLSKVAKAYMAIIGDGKSGIFCEDSLDRYSTWSDKTKMKIFDLQDGEKFDKNSKANLDLLLTNPPFGADIKITGSDKLSQFQLATKEKISKEGVVTTESTSLPPQILFVERGIDLLRGEPLLGSDGSIIKDTGRAAIVLPESFFHTKKYSRVMDFVCGTKENPNNIEWIIDLSGNTFQPFTGAKCCVIILQKNKPQQELINMAVAEQVGHNHLGKPIYRWDNVTNSPTTEIWDDTLSIIEEAKSGNFTDRCFKVPFDECAKRKIWVPRYYHPKSNQIQELDEEKYDVLSIQDLINRGFISTYDGHGSPPSEFKGKGEIPYVRVKDIVSNFEIYKDPDALVPEEIYNKYTTETDVKKKLAEGDILFLWRGSKKIGATAIVSPNDTKAVITKEIAMIRVKKDIPEDQMNPYYLLWLLNRKFVQDQVEPKVLIDTTLMTIGKRWKELKLPVHKDKAVIMDITQKIKEVFAERWNGLSNLNEIMSNTSKKPKP